MRRRRTTEIGFAGNSLWAFLKTSSRQGGFPHPPASRQSEVAMKENPDQGFDSLAV
jgi:hypothetical protein